MLKRRLPPHYFLAFAGLMVWLLWSRLIGINYDNSLHLHPDERWLIMLTGKIHFFDQLNPDFFAYGSLPIYTLKAIVQGLDSLIGTRLDSYDQALFVGRFLVSGFDIVVAGLVFLITRFLTKSNRTAWLSALAYSLFFFMIQSSNFFIVDHFLSLFLTLSLWFGLNLLESFSFKTITRLGVVFGLGLASKITALVALPVLGLMILASVHNHISKGSPSSQHSRSSWHDWPWKKFIIYALASGFWFLIVATIVFSIAMPYAIISHQQFLNEIKTQLSMNSDPYVFPYTLQYVNTLPYWYYLKNIFLWGIGPVASILTIIGVAKLKIKAFSSLKNNLLSGLKSPITLFLLFYGIYFLVIGKSAVKFMRYMQPMYPMLAVGVGVGLSVILQNKRINHNLSRLITWTLIIIMGIWTLSFVSIYTKKHPRIAATEWMNKNFSARDTIAIEHWDDRLPLYTTKALRFEELQIYNVPDDQRKWNTIRQQLNKSDYVVLASNRLWVPLPKLADCKTHKKCYPMAAQYYQNLLSDSLQFKKVKEFTNYPSVTAPFGKITINDDFADESFTVYDHPKVMIFKNTKKKF